MISSVLEDPCKQKIREIYGHEPRSLDELAECVIACVNYSGSTASPRYQNSESRPRVLGFAWDIKRSNQISNSHNCPLMGVTNLWREDTNLPQYYAGYSGRVWIRMTRNWTWVSDLFEHSLTYTGSGGRGSYSGPWAKIASVYFERFGNGPHKNPSYPEPVIYSWDYRFYSEDWPELFEEKEYVFNLLKNQPMSIVHKYEWQDPETVERDLEFMQMVTASELING